MNTARLFIGNVAYNLDEVGLAAEFERQGFTVENPKIARDKETKRPRGFAFIEIDETKLAELVKLDGQLMIGGRPIRIERAAKQPADDRPRASNGGGGGGRRPHGGGGGGGGNRERERDAEPWREERRRSGRRT
jgi:cold-inducible RNA-binding protein